MRSGRVHLNKAQFRQKMDKKSARRRQAGTERRVRRMDQKTSTFPFNFLLYFHYLSSSPTRRSLLPILPATLCLVSCPPHSNTAPLGTACRCTRPDERDKSSTASHPRLGHRSCCGGGKGRGPMKTRKECSNFATPKSMGRDGVPVFKEISKNHFSFA